MADTTFNGTAVPELTPEQELRKYDLRDLWVETIAIAGLLSLGVIGCLSLLQVSENRNVVHEIALLVLLFGPLLHIAFVARYAWSLFFDRSGKGKGQLSKRYLGLLSVRGAVTAGIVGGTFVGANVPNESQHYLWFVIPLALLVAWAARDT